jgi:hypothetical protein
MTAEEAIDAFQHVEVGAEKFGVVAGAIHDFGDGGIKPSRRRQEAHDIFRARIASIRPVCPFSAR